MIIIPARKESQRCKNKLLRPFYDNHSLISLCASKYSNQDNVYIAAHEDEFKEIADATGIGFIKRSKRSAMSEDATIIHEYLHDFKSYKICMLSGCNPFLKASTTHKFIQERSSIPSAVMVKRSVDVIMDAGGVVLNKDLHCFNSKTRQPFYIVANAGYIFEVAKFLNSGVFWDYKPNDPGLFEIDEIEAVDIDTELDFRIAQLMAEENATF